ASFFRSSSDESMSVCGSDRKMSTPSKRWPSTSATAVISSMVSKSITGSASGPPLPTRPGHVALCSLGYWYLLSALIDLLPWKIIHKATQRTTKEEKYFVIHLVALWMRLFLESHFLPNARAMACSAIGAMTA